MKTLRRILIGFVAVAVLAAGGAYVFWPSTWVINAPVASSLFGWSVDAATDSKLRRQLQLPAGYQINRYAVGLGTPRLMRWTKGGDLLVSIPAKGEVVLIGRDETGSGHGGPARVLLSGLDKPHGLEIYAGYLYVAEQGAVARVPFDDGKGVVTGKIERVLTGLPAGGNHWTRTLRMGPDGWMYVSVGSSCNVCVEEDRRRAAILRFRPDGSGEEIFATGLRNTVGFDFDAKAQLWGVDNGRDMLGDDTPPEELNRIAQGKFYGWPYRYGDNLPDPDFGKTDDPRAAAAVPPAFKFPAHMAPLSIRFLKDTKNLPGLEHAALVVFHGSWNRTRKQGYQVVSLHWDADGRISVAPFITGFEKNEEVIGRPVDTSQGPDGAIYVSDDYAGVIYRVSHGTSAAATDATPVRPASVAPASPNDVAVARGEKLFNKVGCTNCHGGGKPAVPLTGLSARYQVEDIAALLAAPPANMPPFPQLKEVEKRDLAAYLLATHK